MPVYMIQAGGFGSVKIGVATDPLARMRQLQTSIPKKLRIVRVLDGGPAEERALHERFTAQRQSGEWFRPTEEMLTADLGLTDLPIPRPKRNRSALDDPATLRGRWRLLQLDLFELIGGEVALAKALGIPPWMVTSWNCHPYHLSALVALARLAGAPITLREALDIRDAADKEHRKWLEDGETARALKDRQDRELKWIEKHGRDNAWWPLDPKNAPPPVAPPAPPEPKASAA